MLVLKGKGSAVTGLAFSPDGAVLAASSSSRIGFWDLATETCDTRTMGVWGAPPDNVRFDPSGQWLLAGFGLQRGLRVIAVRTPGVKQVGTFDANSLAVSRSGVVLVGAGRIAAFGITKSGLSARKWSKNLNGFYIAGLDFFPDGTQFATVEQKYDARSETGIVTRVRVRASRDGRLIREAESDGPLATTARVSPDGRWIAFPSTKSIIVHDGTDLARSVKVPNPSKKPATGLAFHPSSRYLAAISVVSSWAIYE